MTIYGKNNRYVGQIQDYVANDDLAGYINSRYGSGWTLQSSNQIADAGHPWLMDDFRPGIGCCTVTALAYVFDYHRRHGDILAVPKLPQAGFNAVEAVAVKHGYSRLKGRTNPFQISSIIKDYWRQIGVQGQGRSHYWISPQTLVSEIDANRPVLMNVTFHYYHFHTVVIVGYEIWQNDSPIKTRTKLFLTVYDGWTRDRRYIDFSAVRHPLSPHFSTFSVSQVIPPDAGG